MTIRNKCDKCGDVIRYGRTKADHFHSQHPEYKFHRDNTKGTSLLVCDICGNQAESFARLVKHHSHSVTETPTEATNKQAMPMLSFPTLRTFAINLLTLLDGYEYQKTEITHLHDLANQRTAKLIEAQKLLADLK
jgi:hypothetical protein